jgi:uridylate kinase
MQSIILSLGGSLIVPDEIDTSFLRKFRSMVLRRIKKYRFVIACGGGRTARKYQEAARSIPGVSKDDLDWTGIAATRVNSWLVKSMFGNLADPAIISDPTKRIKSKKPIIIASGWKPGFSTDFDSVILAKQAKAKAVINLTNVDYVYNKDPRKFRDAKPIKRIAWKEFKKIVGGKWTPGLNLPFDPIAAKEAEKSKIRVLLINGKDLKSIENAILGKAFKGTEIF